MFFYYRRFGCNNSLNGYRYPMEQASLLWIRKHSLTDPDQRIRTIILHYGSGSGRLINGIQIRHFCEHWTKLYCSPKLKFLKYGYNIFLKFLWIFHKKVRYSGFRILLIDPDPDPDPRIRNSALRARIQSPLGPDSELYRYVTGTACNSIIILLNACSAPLNFGILIKWLK